MADEQSTHKGGGPRCHDTALDEHNDADIPSGRFANAQAGGQDCLREIETTPGTGDWICGRAIGIGGLRRYFLFRPYSLSAGERLLLLVMLHGCSQNASNFASSTRMNAVAAWAHALVMYLEQDLRFNPQGCWNWHDTKSGQANAEASTLMTAIKQVCLLYPVDRKAVAIAGFPAGASMAALLASRHPERFCAVAMHSGVPPGSAHSAASAVTAMGGLQRTTEPRAACRHGRRCW